MVTPQDIFIITFTPEKEEAILNIYNENVSIQTNIIYIQPLLEEHECVVIRCDDGDTYNIYKDYWE